MLEVQELTPWDRAAVRTDHDDRLIEVEELCRHVAAREIEHRDPAS